MSLHSSWILPETFPSAADSRLEILGARGSAATVREMSVFTPGHSEHVAFGGPRTADEVDGRIVGAFVDSLEAFLDAVAAEDCDGPTSARRTLHVVDVQAAVLASAERGAEVTVDTEAPDAAREERRS